MKLSIWTYEGPPHVGAMRVATAMEKLHFVLHAPQGDTYADLLFTMIERGNKRPPVTYTTFQARDLGADTADLFKKACKEAVERFNPEALLVGASCTAELIQDDPGGLADALQLKIPVIPLELPSYQRKENFGTDETFYQIVKTLACTQEKTEKFSVNILGPNALGFRHRDDVRELKTILSDLNVDLNVVAPLGAAPRHECCQGCLPGVFERVDPPHLLEEAVAPQVGIPQGLHNGQLYAGQARVSPRGLVEERGPRAQRVPLQGSGRGRPKPLQRCCAQRLVQGHCLHC